MTEKDKEDARKVYAMVENIDDNIGRLTKKLQELKIDENTIIIFMTDNGPQQRRYVAGMKGRKGSVYRGGVRVPFYMKISGRKMSPRKSLKLQRAILTCFPPLQTSAVRRWLTTG
jgi:arylsulfatase A-like enzyme